MVWRAAGCESHFWAWGLAWSLVGGGNGGAGEVGQGWVACWCGKGKGSARERGDEIHVLNKGKTFTVVTVGW